MTVQDPPARRSKLVTPLHIIEALIIVGLLLWHFGAFRKTPNIAIITSGEGSYWDLVEAGAKKAADQYDCNFTMIRCKTDAMAQVDAINKALAEKYDGIAISPINPTIEAGALADVATSATLVTLDSDSAVARRLCFVGTDNYEAGHLCAQIVRDALPDGGELLISIGNVEKQNTQRRRQGLIDELLDRDFDPERAMDPVDQPLKGSKYTIVTTLVDGGDPAMATELAEKALKEHPNVKCLVGLLSYTGTSLVAALGDKAGKIPVVGFDVAETTLAGIENGSIAGTILQDQFGFGYHAVRILSENARGEKAQMPVFDKQTLPCEIVNKNNVAGIRGRINPSAGTQPS
jgi:ribose transport system substrate-binding protein